MTIDRIRININMSMIGLFYLKTEVNDLIIY